MIAAVGKKTLLTVQILILLFIAACGSNDIDYPEEIDMPEDNIIVEDTELDFESPRITNEAFNILALEYLSEKYGEEFQLFDDEKREDDGTGAKAEWEKERPASYKGFYSSVAHPTHPFFVFMQSPYRSERDNTKTYDSYVYAKMSVRFEKEIRELTKGLWDEFTVTAGLTYIDLSPNQFFFDEISKAYSEDVPIDKYVRENSSLSTLILVSIRGNYDRIIDREAEREKIQVLHDEIFEKQYSGGCSITYFFPDTYDNKGSNEGVQHELGYYENVQLDTSFYPQDEDGNVRLTHSITLENGEETFGFRMYEYPLNEFMSYAETGEPARQYDEERDTLEYGKEHLRETYPEHKEVFDNSGYEFFEGPFLITGVGDAYIIVDLNKLGLKHEDITILQIDSELSGYIYVDIAVPIDFRILPDGKIMFNKHSTFAIAKRR